MEAAKKRITRIYTGQACDVDLTSSILFHKLELELQAIKENQ